MTTRKRPKRDKTAPPRLPESMEDAELAVLYLGALSQGGNLGDDKRELLREVLGALPRDATEARWWKTLAKQARRRLSS